MGRFTTAQTLMRDPNDLTPAPVNENENSSGQLSVTSIVVLPGL